jgi:hypothetical protein
LAVSERLTLTLWNPQQGYQAILQVWALAKSLLFAGHRVRVKVEPETRSNEQNDRMWAMLTEVSRQVDWYGKRLSPEDWKHVFTASLRKLDVVPNIEGTGFVALGLSTSKMSKREMSDLMELIAAFGAERGVTFKEEA